MIADSYCGEWLRWLRVPDSYRFQKKIDLVLSIPG